MFKVNNKGTRTTELWTYFTPSSSVSIVNFEHVIAGWEILLRKNKMILSEKNMTPYPSET